MKDNYNDYLNVFNNLTLDDKRSYIIDNLEELIKSFYKINIDYDKKCDILEHKNEFASEDDYLLELFKVVLSLRGVSGNTMNIIAEELYEGIQ